MWTLQNLKKISDTWNAISCLITVLNEVSVLALANIWKNQLPLIVYIGFNLSDYLDVLKQGTVRVKF